MWTEKDHDKAKEVISRVLEVKTPAIFCAKLVCGTNYIAQHK